MKDFTNANKTDLSRIKWFYDEYTPQDIPTLLTYNMNLCPQFKLSEEELTTMDNLLKAIRQDIKKIFTCLSDIDKIYSESKHNSSSKKSLSDNEREIIAIYIEYSIAKYRVIIEYTLKILDMVITFPVNCARNKKKLKDYEIYNLKLDYLKELISDDRRSILNDQWFQSIRKTRNSLIHEGATCVVFPTNTEKLFQIYDLECNELVVGDLYLYNGNCAHFDYFFTLNFSYLVFFIDSVFSVLLSNVQFSANDALNEPLMASRVNSMLNTVFDKQKTLTSWCQQILQESSAV